MDKSRHVEIVEYTFGMVPCREVDVNACFARCRGLEYAFLNETSEVSYKILSIGNGFPLNSLVDCLPTAFQTFTRTELKIPCLSLEKHRLSINHICLQVVHRPRRTPNRRES